MKAILEFDLNDPDDTVAHLLLEQLLYIGDPTSTSNNTEIINQIIQKIIQTIKPINQILYPSTLLTILEGST